MAEKYKRKFYGLKHVFGKINAMLLAGEVGAHIAVDKIQIRIIFICLFLEEFVEG